MARSIPNRRCSPFVHLLQISQPSTIDGLAMQVNVKVLNSDCRTLSEGHSTTATDFNFPPKLGAEGADRKKCLRNNCTWANVWGKLEECLQNCTARLAREKVCITNLLHNQILLALSFSSPFLKDSWIKCMQRTSRLLLVAKGNREWERIFNF